MKYGMTPEADCELLEKLAKDEFNKTYYMLTDKERKEVDYMYMETVQQYDVEFYERNYPYYK